MGLAVSAGCRVCATSVVPAPRLAPSLGFPLRLQALLPLLVLVHGRLVRCCLFHLILRPFRHFSGLLPLGQGLDDSTLLPNDLLLVSVVGLGPPYRLLLAIGGCQIRSFRQTPPLMVETLRVLPPVPAVALVRVIGGLHLSR